MSDDQIDHAERQQKMLVQALDERQKSAWLSDYDEAVRYLAVIVVPDLIAEVRRLRGIERAAYALVEGLGNGRGSDFICSTCGHIAGPHDECAYLDLLKAFGYDDLIATTA